MDGVLPVDMMSSEATRREVEILATRIRSLPVAGREISPRGKTSCIMCRRMIGPIGRLLYPGAPTCTEERCETIKAASVTELFGTPYGRSLDLYTLRTFLRCLDGPSVFVERATLVDRASELAKAYVDLERWQWAFSAWTIVHRPEGSRLGRTVLIPPRRIDEVTRVRLRGGWATVDPSEAIEEPTRTELRQIWERGPSAEAIPF